MVITENKELEAAVLAGNSCIAVPVEVFVPTKGEPIITAYSFCEGKAVEWAGKFERNLLSIESMNWLDSNFSSIVENLGYKRVDVENEMMVEYIYTPDMHLPKEIVGVTVCKISSNAVLTELCMNSGCDIEIADDGEDVIFAVVENGVILAYAGMNDIMYKDGSVEINVETAKDHQRKGYASACVLELVKHLLNLGKTVRYKCSQKNFASSSLAEACGFALEGKRFSYVCEKI